MTPRQRRAELALKAPSIVRYVLIALLVPTALVGLLLLLRHEVARSERLRAKAALSYERRISQIELLSRLKDAETAQYGFLLTGDRTFLRFYQPARRDVLERLRTARRSRDPDVSPAYVAEVGALVDAKFAELDRHLASARANDPAEEIAASQRGRRLMDELRAVIGRMIAQEETISADRQRAFVSQRVQLQRLVWGIFAILSLVLLGALAILWRLRRERYRSLVARFEASERNAIILDSTVDAILILNPAGAIEVMNAAATRMLGYTRDELSRRDVAAMLDIAPGEDSFKAHVELVEGSYGRSFLADRTVRHRDGREIAVDVVLGVMSLPSGDHLVISLRDISERKRIERVKDDLVSTVSHELRTPLTSIIGSLGLLRSGAAGAIPTDAARLVEIAENNSRRLIRLINDMLDIDRIESGELHLARAPVDLRTVIDQACTGSEGLARTRDVTLACAMADHPVTVSADADRILQVVTNLLSNAIRAAPTGSTVDLSLAVDAETAVVSVEDRGSGIPLPFRDRIFGRFERAEIHDGSASTGLGLAISREIVVRHDGRIWFEDRAGGGTAFRFSLATLDRPATRSDAAAPRILVCEHDPAIATMLGTLVLGEGCIPDVAADAATARTAMAAHRYAALIIDLALPGTGGLAFAREVREHDPPFDAEILVVAQKARGDGDAPSPLDVVDWIDKPGETDRLARALHAALARTGSPRPTVLHLDDDPDLLEVVSAAFEPDVRIISATSLAAAREILQHASPDAVILDLRLAEGTGTDLIPFLVDADGLAIPTIIYSAQDVSDDLAAQVDAVLVKARGSIPDLKASLHRLVGTRGEQREDR